MSEYLRNLCQKRSSPILSVQLLDVSNPAFCTNLSVSRNFLKFHRLAYKFIAPRFSLVSIIIRYLYQIIFFVLKPWLNRAIKVRFSWDISVPMCHMQRNEIFHVALLHRYFSQSEPSGMILGLVTNNGPNVYPGP